jgi:selenocysteine lyase/cysteine desulfurase
MKRFFPSLTRYNYIFCENAGGTQVPYQVINRCSNFLKTNYLQRGFTNVLSTKLSHDIDEIYKTTNIILNNREGKLFFGSSTSQLCYNLANSLENYILENKNSEIILNDFNHEACLTPFERIGNKNNLKIKYWKLDNFNIDYKSLFESINNNTRLVVLPHASNILGNQIDLKYIVNEIKKINRDTLVLADGVAYMPHDIVDVDDYNIDFYLVSFYKFCGLRISVLYCKKNNEKLLKNQNHYFLEDIIDKKLDLGGMNFETAYSILGIKDYLLNIENNKVFTREIFCKIMRKLINYENTMINIINS